MSAKFGDQGKAVDYVVHRIMRMLMSMTLLPGESIRQEALAEKFEVSRAPIREALRLLQSQGLVEHRPNAGYSVRRLTRGELTQVYRMRELLETELLRHVVPAVDELLETLVKINADMDAAVAAEEHLRALELNKEFHFRLFETSGLDLVVREVDRLWMATEVYRAYSSYDPDSTGRAHDDHNAIIEALRRGDVDGLIEAMDVHREIPGRFLAPILATE